VAVTIATLIVSASAVPFVLFPKAGKLPSPDGRFEVRNANRNGSDKDFIGTSHSLWLVESATGRARKLCNYLGVAAVTWSGNNFVVVTEYVGKKTSRAWVFPIDTREALVFDQPSLIQMVPVELRTTLRENDHVFIEASSVEAETIHLRVWGYGSRDARGFHWSCTYEMRKAAISCR
jgi:hypothetical protein